MKRYAGDKGRLTTYHLITNGNNLIPVLRKLDPSIFVDHEKITKKKIKEKQDQALKKHIERTKLKQQEREQQNEQFYNPLANKSK